MPASALAFLVNHFLDGLKILLSKVYKTSCSQIVKKWFRSLNESGMSFLMLRSSITSTRPWRSNVFTRFDILDLVNIYNVDYKFKSILLAKIGSPNFKSQVEPSHAHVWLSKLFTYDLRKHVDILVCCSCSLLNPLTANLFCYYLSVDANFLHLLTWHHIFCLFLTLGTKLFFTVYFSANCQT